MDVSKLEMNSMRFIRLPAITLFVLQLVSSIVHSQSLQDANLTLTVVNYRDELLANVSVKLSKKNLKIEPVISSTQTSFRNLETGEFLLEVEAVGYEPFSKKIRIIDGKNTLTVQLDLLKIIENVEVKRDKESSLIDNAFSGFFTREQIDALPENGKDIERELRRRYGPDVIIRVDGFSDKVPDKSKIASIKATQSSYDAENHELGFTYVDITTKVGQESFGGSIGFDFNTQSLNARPTLGRFKLPDTNRAISFNLFGPIKQNRTAFDLFVTRSDTIKKTSLIAVLQNNEIPEYVSSITSGTSIDSDVYHNLAENHNLKVRFTFYNARAANLGIGGLDLPERAFSNTLVNQRLTISESGYFQNKYFNEVRFFYQDNQTEINPSSDLPTIQVIDAFNSGGANNKSFRKGRTFWVSDNFLFGYKSHAIKLGGVFEVQSANEVSSVNQNGTFIFSSIRDFENNQPSLFRQTPSPRSSSVSTRRIGVFVQDDFKVNPNLGLSLGFRYETQNGLSDFSNLSPRLGFTWVPKLLKETVVRGGVGVFYQWLELPIISYVSNRSVLQPNEITIINPTYPLITSNVILNRALPSYWLLGNNLQNPSIFHTSLGFNSSLTKNADLRINYVFQRGAKLFRTVDTNSPVDGIRPIADFSGIYQVESTGSYARNSLDISFGGVLKRGVTYSVNYTLQKKISDSEGIYSFPSNNRDLDADEGPSNDDQRHRLSGNINWKIRRGVLLTAIYKIDSPLPYTITTGFDDNGDTIFNDRPNGALRNGERGAWRRQLDLGLSYTFSFYKFEKTRKGKTKIIYSGSEIARDNETIDRNKRFQTKFYVSAFNIFNSSNYINYVGVQTSPLFRQPITAAPSRRVEVGVRLGF